MRRTAPIEVKCGLKLEDVALVVNESTRWSSASERIQPTLSQRTATADNPPRLMVKDLKLTRRIAVKHRAPMLIADAACSLYEMSARKSVAGIDAMARQYESMAKVQFVGT